MRIDPTYTHDLESLDFGSAISPDGREYPITATTPVSMVSLPGVLSGNSGTSGTAPTAQNVSLSPSDLFQLFTGQKHVGARLVIGILAIGIILIAVLRLTR